MEPIEFAWVCRNKHFNKIERVELTDQKMLQRIFPSWIVTDNCEVLAKIHPTGFYDINGLDPTRKLWGRDVLVCKALDKLKYGVITWDSLRGQWILQTEISPYALYLWLEWGAKHAGDVWRNRELVPWWKEGHDG